MLDPAGGMATFLKVADWFMTVCFTIELAIKCAVLGVALHKGSYFRSSWNWLDSFIVVISWFSIVTDSSSVGALRALRALRARRPGEIGRTPGEIAKQGRTFRGEI